MKTIRSLLALICAAAFAGSLAFAAPKEDKKSEKPAKADCGCATGKDGKVCGVDKDCCCSGEKAKGAAKKSEKCDDDSDKCDMHKSDKAEKKAE